MSTTEGKLCPIPAPGAERPPQTAPATTTVLLVESDPFLANLAESRIEQLSAGSALVVQVDSLAAALLAIGSGDADVVLANPNLSDSQGLETIVLLLQQALEVPLIVLCGSEEEELAVEALRFGAQDYIAREKLGTENILRIIRHSTERHALNLRLDRKVRKIEAMRRRFRSVVEDNADGMVVVDEDGTVCYANPAAYDLLGQDPESLNGKPFGLPIEGHGTSEVDIVRSDGPHIVADIRAMETTWGGHPARIATLRDVTARKEKETGLKDAEQRANQAWQLKAEFLANMSHELRTPLNSIVGFADLLNLQVHGPVGDIRYQEYLANIRQSGRRLLSLVNDLLDLSKAEAGKLELRNRRMDLGTTIDAIMAEALPDAELRGVELISDIGRNQVFVWADRDRIEQILRSILSNSLKFSAPGGEVRIAASVLASGGLMVTIRDGGEGIAPEELPLVFSPFTRAETAYTRSEGQGPGLGLVIAKQLVELHDGKISIDSAPGEGTTVSVTLPPQRILPPGRYGQLKLVSG